MKVKVTNRPEYASEVVDSLLLRRNVIVFVLMGLMAFLGIWNVVGGATRSDMGDIGVGALYLFFDLLLGGVLLFARYKQIKGFAEAIRFTCTGSPQQEVLFAEQIVAERYGEDGELIGKTVTDYVGERKMLLAKGMIQAGEHSLQEIAAELGFENYAYFSRLFKRHFHVTPMELKKRLSE